MNLYVYNATDFISLYHNLDHYISNNKVIIFSPKTDCGLTIDQVFEKLKYHYENIQTLESLKEKNLIYGNNWPIES